MKHSHRHWCMHHVDWIDMTLRVLAWLSWGGMTALQDHPPPKPAPAPQAVTRPDPRMSPASPQRPSSLQNVPLQTPGFDSSAFETSFPASNASQGGTRPLKPSLSSLAAQDRARPSNIPGPSSSAPRAPPVSNGDAWRLPARG